MPSRGGFRDGEEEGEGGCLAEADLGMERREKGKERMDC